MKNNQIMDFLVTGLAPIIWGSTYVVTTEMLPPDKPLLASALRSLPAGLLLLAVCRTLPTGQWWWKTVVLGVLNIGAFFYFLFVAAYLLPGGVAALVLSTQPVIVMLISALFLRENIRTSQVVACGLGVIGVALVVLQPSANLNSLGIVAGIGGAASMAAGIVLAKRWARPEGVSVLDVTGWQLTTGGILLFPMALLVEGTPTQFTQTNILGYVYLCVFGALFAYTVWFRGIGRLPAISVSFLSLSSPLSAMILGAIFLNQTLKPLQIVGAVAVLAAIIFAQKGAANRRVTRARLQHQQSM